MKNKHFQSELKIPDVFTGYKVKCPCCNKNLIIRCFKSGKHGVRLE